MTSHWTYGAAITWLNELIPHGTAATYPGQRGIDRTARLLVLLNHPEKRFHVVHVAGTSGKGSTAYLISLLLVGQGFRTGLALSPYLLDVRERCMVNNQLPEKAVVAECLATIQKAVQTLQAQGEQPTYFEVVTVLALHLFACQGCQYAVLETGLGGTFDATNAVQSSSKLGVLTRIGLDHTKTLGGTIGAIAKQKVGILHLGNTGLTLRQDPVVNAVFADRASAQGATLVWVDGPDEVTVTREGTQFRWRGVSFVVGLLGRYQAENSVLALEAIRTLAARDRWPVDDAKLHQTVAQAQFPGRFEIRTIRGKTVIFDGAHNPQKLTAFFSSARELLPNTPLTIVVAFRDTKDVLGMLKALDTVPGTVIATEFEVTNDLPIRSVPANDIKTMWHRRHPARAITVVKDPRQALAAAFSTPNTAVIVTGSLYLLSVLYPDLEMLGNVPRSTYTLEP